MSLKIGLVYDLRSDYRALGYDEEQIAEFDCEETIAGLEDAIAANGHTPVRIGNARALTERLVAGDRWDLVFNIAEGLHGRCRESQVPSILELYGIGYTFSDALVCAATLDKAVAKRLIHTHNLPTPKFCVMSAPPVLSRIDLRYPLFAKPIAEGTGKGVSDRSRIDSFEQLHRTCCELLDRFKQPVLVEEFLPGREFTVAIVGNGEQARVFGGMEIHFNDNAIYSYETKQDYERLVRYTPLGNDPLCRQVSALALDSYRALECRDAARVDIRCDADGTPCFMEVNPLPGLNPVHSDLPIIAGMQNISYAELIGMIIDAAVERLGLACTQIQTS